MAQSPSAVAARITRALAKVRKEHGVTTEQLAERLGTAVQNVRRIEAGQNITLVTLVRFAQAIGVTVEVVLTPDPAGPRNVGRGRKG